MNSSNQSDHPDAARWRTMVLDYLRPRVWQRAAAERLASQTVDQAMRESRRVNSLEDDAEFRKELMRIAIANLQKYVATLEVSKGAAWIHACLEADRKIDLAPNKKPSGMSWRMMSRWLATGSTALALLLVVFAYQQFGGKNPPVIEVAERPAEEAHAAATQPENETLPHEKIAPAPEEKTPVVEMPIAPPPPQELKEKLPVVPPVVVDLPPPPKAPVHLAGKENEPRDINDPEAEVIVGELNGGQAVILRGKIKRLVVDVVNGRSLLDASGLEAKEIVFKRSINGESSVKVNAPQGKVTFLQDINGRSNVEVVAPGGVVQFHEGIDGQSKVQVTAIAGQVSFGRPMDPAALERCTINGESQITIVARQVDVGGVVDGTQTRINVALSKMGTLKFHKITGAVKLHYKKENVGDPEPMIERGTVVARAEVKQID